MAVNSFVYSGEDNARSGLFSSVTKSYSITYLTEDGQVDVIESHHQGESFLIRAVSKRGYTFKWWTNNDGTQYAAEQEVLADKDLTLTPVFSVNRYKYFIKYINEIDQALLREVERTANYGVTIYSVDNLEDISGYFQTTDDNIIISDTNTDNIMRIYYRPNGFHPLTMAQVAQKGHFAALMPRAITVKNMTLTNMNIDELYAAVPNNRELYDNWNIYQIPDKWDINTVMKAEYENDYRAGNIHKTIEEIDAVRLRKMAKGEYLWTVLKEIPVNVEADLKFTYTDRYENSGEEIRYSIVPVYSNSIGTSIETSVMSKFEGIAISNSNITYRAFVYDYPSLSRTHSYAAVTTLRGKYPYVFRNAQYNYISGSVSAGFFPVETVENVFRGGPVPELVTRPDEITLHNEEFIDFLTDGTPKLIKFDDGRSWIVAINDTVTYGSPENGYYTQFTFTQIGDPKNEDDLYEANLIDWEPVGGVT